MKFIIALLALFLVQQANAAGSRRTFTVESQYRDEGNDRVPFNINCSSTGWTTIVSSEPTRRSLLVQTPPTNAADVCVSTVTATGTNCDSNTSGIELAANSAWTDYTDASWTCRVAQGSSTQTLKGYWARDTSDMGGTLK